MERRLTAILAAAVVGYSRLMSADEEGTLAQLKGHRNALVDPKIAENRGRIVKTTGDGLLVEFASVVDALRCDVEVQPGMAERNVDVPQDKRIEFRMSIHQGDVITEAGDIFGDGVNVAARLEALAQPGASACPVGFTRTPTASSRSLSRIWASNGSRTSPDPSASFELCRMVQLDCSEKRV